MDKRIYFYKYYDIEAGILTLENASRKWANPRTFNDIFDNQFEMQIKGDEDDLKEQGANFLMDIVLNGKPIPDRLPSEEQIMLQYIKSIPKEEFKKVISKLKTEKNLYPSGYVKNAQKKLNEGTQNVMSDVSIFCLTESKDNLLMWAHYAGNHTGIVVEFQDIPEADSPIKLAQKVIYVDKVPQISYQDIFQETFSTKELLDMHTLTKDKVWEYEKEWRIVSGLRDKNKAFEIIPFEKKEVANVYLGCKITNENKNKIIQIIKTKYSWANIYQAIKSSSAYKLKFDKLSI